MKRIVCLIAAVVCGIAAIMADDAIDTRQRIFDPDFRTLQLKVDGNDMVAPVIGLNDNRRLTIGFDELTSDRSYLRYELIHCNSDWKPSGLVGSEFLTGFNEGEVETYAFSRATLVHYVHYEIELPNSRIEFTTSGNYLLRVYREDDPETTLLQARFYVEEATMKLAASMTSRTDIDFNSRHQQLSVAVETDRVPVRDMWRDLRLVVSQNGRNDDLRTPEAATRVAGTRAYFEHTPALIFPAGNEYRRMEVISTSYPTMGVESIGKIGPAYQFWLHTDRMRSGASYAYDQTQHGRFRIREYSSDEPDTEADYVGVMFTLDAPEAPNGDIFIDADFTGRSFGPESRMVYNRATGLYEFTAMLKQGAYNYQYLYVPNGSMRGSTAEIEGDYHQTSNEYFIRLYHRAPGERYDRLTSVMTLMGNGN